MLMVTLGVMERDAEGCHIPNLHAIAILQPTSSKMGELGDV